jgi:hypothetical protein
MFFSCKKNHDKSGTFMGAEQAIQHGKGWAWIKVDIQGIPQQVGVSINQAALNSMPIGSEEPSEGHTHENIVILPLHPIAKAITPFDHIQLDWNPAGHPPFEIYGKPHFDFHFYMVSEAEVSAAVDPVKLDLVPAPAYLPANYFSAGPVPQMGTHFLDATSPEFHGQPFTETFVYGTYNGNVTFYEPMITLDFLKATSAYERSIPQPDKFKTSGYYPTKMKIVKQNGVTTVILDGFVKRQAS